MYYSKISAPICFNSLARHTVLPLHKLHTKVGMEGKTKLLTRDGWSWVRQLNLPDLVLAVGPRRSPVHLLATPPASLLSMHRELWRSYV